MGTDKLWAPNIVNLCVDETEHGDISGRIYHCYAREPYSFHHVPDLVGEMEKLFDKIVFPQASTRTRRFTEKKAEVNRKPPERPQRQQGPKEVTAHRGRRGTFLVCVQFRQNSSWQGEVTWAEQDETSSFISMLELLTIIDSALEKTPDTP
jgi:hypothetical protein